MRGNLVETLIGAIVLVVAGVFLYFAYSQTDVGPVDGYEVKAKFNSVSGITIGSDVRISGIKVGSVTSQTLDPTTYEGVLTLSVRGDVELPEDTSARISLDGLLGGSFVALVPGGSPDMLVNGDSIEFTQGAIDIVGLIGRFIYGSADSGSGDSTTGNAAPSAPASGL